MVFPLVRENRRMLQRAVVYTAMSRASQLLVLVADPLVLQTAAAAAEPSKRLTNLQRRIRKRLTLSNQELIEKPPVKNVSILATARSNIANNSGGELPGADDVDDGPPF